MAHTTLGISLGSRTTGLAIIKGNELVVARSLTLRNKQTIMHTATLDNYILQYQIEHVVIKTPPVTHHSERLKSLLQQIIKLFTYHGCMVQYCDNDQIKKYHPLAENKNNAIQEIAQSYPRLVPLIKKEQCNKQKYHMKMFEAVTIAHIAHAKNLST